LFLYTSHAFTERDWSQDKKIDRITRKININSLIEKVNINWIAVLMENSSKRAHLITYIRHSQKPM